MPTRDYLATARTTGTGSGTVPASHETAAISAITFRPSPALQEKNAWING